MNRRLIRSRIMLAAALFAGSAMPIHPAETRAGESLTEPSPRSNFLGLEEAIRIGLSQHPLIQQTRYTSVAAKAVTKQTRGELYPWLEASVAESNGSLRITTSDGQIVHGRGGIGFLPGAALPHHNQNMLTGGLILNQLITDFGYTAQRILANEANEAASEKEILTNKAVIILTIQKAYLTCLLQQSLVEIAGETVKRRNTLRDQVQALYKHQLKSKVDLDLILVEVSNAKLAFIRAQNDLTQAFATLNNAMGVEGSDRYELAKIPIMIAPTPDLPHLVEVGLADRPELLGNRDRLVASEELLKAAKALNLGSLSAVGTIGVTKYWDVHDEGIHDNQVAPLWGAGATMKFPLFTGFRIQNQIKEAGHHQGETQHELENLSNEVVLQIVRAYLTQTTNAEQIPLEREQVSFAREALSLAQERYKQGLSPIVEVVRATTALFEAESRLAEAQYIYKISEAAVAYATGQDYKRF
ncbi:MAG: TolC family protein [Nitrospira sp.]|nr:MAG: TolC family protein [Nitrospira sp.]